MPDKTFTVDKMRAVCFVKRLQWDVPGTLFMHGMTIGDVDNDGDNELVVGTAEGDLYIFKGTELWQKITGLGLVTSVAIGDIFNYGRNALIAISGDGWIHIYYSPRSVNPGFNTLHSENSTSENGEPLDHNVSRTKAGSLNSTIDSNTSDHKNNVGKSDESTGKMECVHVQRIPANTKVVLIADVDQDGANELIIGLTDRVVRSYRWSSNADLGSGKLVGLNKWECTNQIGSVTLQDDSEGKPTLLVAQPGGTFMRIKCNTDDCQVDDECFNDSSKAAASIDYQTLGKSRMRNPNISTEILGNLKPKIKSSPDDDSIKCMSSNDTTRHSSFSDDLRNKCTVSEDVSENNSPGVDDVDGNVVGGNIIFQDFDTKRDGIDYLEDGNNNIRGSDSKLDDLKKQINSESQTKKNSKSYALATLDGTIMLVKDEIILWAMQVDHHIAALCPLDVTGDGADEIIACSWDGQTYILDQQRNSVRFQFEDPVRAFCAGMYSVFPRSSTPCLVYNNFHNKIFLYYDVSLPSMMVTALNAEGLLEQEEQKEMLRKLLTGSSDCEREAQLKQLTEWLLYGTH
ncbi:KICSTOR complex protein ITFG2 [Copidosoma floridanum]|uniref:KICSTOR complex protein ITFG2 n=1 Tax=Copidosoma floridanum TaxID=29053 RepID=UPI0006C98751|nr:KICSTOR complex protein ITFG2 [Copidosoma floridanum]